MKIFDVPQNSPEWHAARCGIATASEFHTVIASGRGGGESKTRRSYLLRLAGEIVTGEPAETYSNHHMERGHAMEPEARDFYALMADAELTPVGFIFNEKINAGCSPDSLIGADGVLEIKTKLPHLMIDCLLDGVVPPENKAQLQGILWIAERDWIDLSIYWPKMPRFTKRVGRDEAYIAMLSDKVAEFNSELAHIVNRIRKMGS